MPDHVTAIQAFRARFPTLETRPSRTGWLRFVHDCGGRSLSAGVNFDIGRATCFRCGWSERLDLGVDVAWAPPPRPTPPPAAPSLLPWRPFTIEDDRVLCVEALAYLATRSVSRDEAVTLGLGYGVRDQWRGLIIHPWYDDEGTLAGWQGRKPFNPDRGPKVLTATAADVTPYLSPADGALYGLEDVRQGEPVALVEGPYDRIGARHVVPACALLGSRLHLAQIRRVLARGPSCIYLALDPDKTVRWWDRIAMRWQPPVAEMTARFLYRRVEGVEVRLVSYPETWAGDLGDPHERDELAAVFSASRMIRA